MNNIEKKSEFTLYNPPLCSLPKSAIFWHIQSVHLVKGEWI